MSSHAETITIQCACGRFLRGTVEREQPEPLPVAYRGNIRVTASQVIALCPGCGEIASTPIELTTSPAKQDNGH
jgi:hypothetical protein